MVALLQLLFLALLLWFFFKMATWGAGSIPDPFADPDHLRQPQKPAGPTKAQRLQGVRVRYMRDLEGLRAHFYGAQTALAADYAAAAPGSADRKRIQGEMAALNRAHAAAQAAARDYARQCAEAEGGTAADVGA